MADIDFAGRRFTLRDFAPDDREEKIRQWMIWQGTPPFVSSPEWEEAQRRKMAGVLGGGGYGGVHPIVALIQQMMTARQQQQQPTLRNVMGGIGF